MTELGLVKALANLLSKFKSGRKSEVKSLKKLADRKFYEFTATHRLFIKTLRSLPKGSSGVLPETPKSRSRKRRLWRS